MRLLAPLLTLLLLVAGCGDDGDELAVPDDADAGEVDGGATPPPVPGSTPLPGDDGADLAEQTLIGTLGGDAQLEGGCAWIDAEDGQRYEVVYPPDYELSFDPLQLTTPQGATYEEGAELAVRGRLAPDTVTICQVGPVFEATSVEAAGG